MCQFISFHHNPRNGDVVVYDLNSHSNTEESLKLNLNIWREGHYLPNGTVELRLADNDRVDKNEYKESFLNKFPTFISFFNWAIRNVDKCGSLDLSSLTSAEGLTLPEKVSGSLYLSSLPKKDREKIEQDINRKL